MFRLSGYRDSHERYQSEETLNQKLNPYPKESSSIVQYCLNLDIDTNSLKSCMPKSATAGELVL